jgi:hypothetical protein
MIEQANTYLTAQPVFWCFPHLHKETSSSIILITEGTQFLYICHNQNVSLRLFDYRIKRHAPNEA